MVEIGSIRKPRQVRLHLGTVGVVALHVQHVKHCVGAWGASPPLLQGGQCLRAFDAATVHGFGAHVGQAGFLPRRLRASDLTRVRQADMADGIQGACRFTTGHLHGCLYGSQIHDALRTVWLAGQQYCDLTQWHFPPIQGRAAGQRGQSKDQCSGSAPETKSGIDRLVLLKRIMASLASAADRPHCGFDGVQIAGFRSDAKFDHLSLYFLGVVVEFGFI